MLTYRDKLTKKPAMMMRIFFIVLLGAVLWGINYCTPLMQDDYLYSTYMSEDDFVPGRANSDIWEVFRSCFHHYFKLNGRMANNLAFFVLYAGGKSLYNVLAALVSLIGLMAMSRVFLGRISVLSICVSGCACFALFPGIYHTCCWCSGAFNYLWGASILLMAIACMSLPRFDDKMRRLMVRAFCLILFALASSMHEMLAAVLLGTAGIFFALCYYKKIPVSLLQVSIALAIALGACLPLMSPGIHNRAGGVEYLSVHFVVKSAAFMLKMAWPALIVFACLLVYHTRKKRFDILYVAAVVSFALAYVMGTHSFTGCAYFYFSLAVILWLLKTIAPYVEKLGKVSRILVVVIFTCIMGLSCCVTLRVHKNVQIAFHQAMQQDVVVLDVDPILETEALAYVSALPINTIYIYPYVAAQHKIKDFMVILRTIRGDEKVFSDMLEQAPSDALVSKRLANDWIYIRLPKNKQCCIFEGLTMSGNPTCRITVSPYMMLLHSEWMTSMYDRYVAKQTFIEGGVDYYGGYVFVLIPPVDEKYTSCSLRLQDMRYAGEENVVVPLN